MAFYRCASKHAMRRYELDLSIRMGHMPSSGSQEPPETQPSDVSGLCVLVVDDSWHVGSGLKSLLESLGADVIGPAATTADAERMVSERRPDVAIVDINLRGGERSYGLIDRLYDQGIRVVVMTGYSDAGVPQGKAAVILQKPIRQDVLLANLRPPAPIGAKSDTQ